MVVPDAPALDATTGLTIDAWINTAIDVVEPTGRIVDKVNPFQEDGYLLDLVGGRLRMQVGRSAALTGVLATAGTFTHVAGVYDGTRIALFVNGVLATEVTTSMDIIPVNDLAVRIGGDAGGGSPFSGIIDEPRIVNRGLSNAEVQTLFDQYAVCP